MIALINATISAVALFLPNPMLNTSILPGIPIELFKMLSQNESTFPKGYDRAYPSAPSGDQCIKSTIQPDDPRVLNTYYYDQNNTYLSMLNHSILSP